MLERRLAMRKFFLYIGILVLVAGPVRGTAAREPSSSGFTGNPGRVQSHRHSGNVNDRSRKDEYAMISARVHHPRAKSIDGGGPGGPALVRSDLDTERQARTRRGAAADPWRAPDSGTLRATFTDSTSSWPNLGSRSLFRRDAHAPPFVVASRPYGPKPSWLSLEGPIGASAFPPEELPWAGASSPPLRHFSVFKDLHAPR
jgi:hypothetical protein